MYSEDLIECKCGCGGHLTKFDRKGRPHSYINHHGARGKGCPHPERRKDSGRYKMSNGYIAVKCWSEPYNGQYVLEHRLLMERHLNRLLHPYDVVHHINGIRDDNRLENLTVMDITEHSRMHSPGVQTRFKKGQNGRRKTLPYTINQDESFPASTSNTLILEH